MSTLTGEALARSASRPISRAKQQPELSRIHLVRGPGDLSSAMPRFVTAYLERQFSA